MWNVDKEVCVDPLTRGLDLSHATAHAPARGQMHKREPAELTDSTDYVVSLLRARDARTPHGRFRHDPSNPSVPVDNVAARSRCVIRRICARVVDAVAVAARVSEEYALRGVQQIGLFCRNIPARSGQRREQSHRPRGKRGSFLRISQCGGDERSIRLASDCKPRFARFAGLHPGLF